MKKRFLVTTANKLVFLPLSLVLVMYFLVDQVVGIKMFFTLASSFFIASLVKYYFPTARPFKRLRVVPVVRGVTDSSFPSIHTTMSSAVAGALLFYNIYFGVIMLFVAFIVGLTRYYAKIHYLKDVFGGMLLGLITAYLVNLIHIRVY